MELYGGNPLILVDELQRIVEEVMQNAPSADKITYSGIKRCDNGNYYLIGERDSKGTPMDYSSPPHQGQEIMLVPPPYPGMNGIGNEAVPVGSLGDIWNSMDALLRACKCGQDAKVQRAELQRLLEEYRTKHPPYLGPIPPSAGY